MKDYPRRLEENRYLNPIQTGSHPRPLGGRSLPEKKAKGHPPKREKKPKGLTVYHRREEKTWKTDSCFTLWQKGKKRSADFQSGITG